MTNEEKIIAMLERVHHENCFIFEGVTRMLTANNKEVVDGVIELIDRWDAEIKAIMEDKDESNSNNN